MKQCQAGSIEGVEHSPPPHRRNKLERDTAEGEQEHIRCRGSTPVQKHMHDSHAQTQSNKCKEEPKRKEQPIVGNKSGHTSVHQHEHHTRTNTTRARNSDRRPCPQLP